MVLLVALSLYLFIVYSIDEHYSSLWLFLMVFFWTNCALHSWGSLSFTPSIMLVCINWWTMCNLVLLKVLWIAVVGLNILGYRKAITISFRSHFALLLKNWGIGLWKLEMSFCIFLLVSLTVESFVYLFYLGLLIGSTRWVFINGVCILGLIYTVY